MCNLERIKKIYKYKGVIRKTLLFKECKNYILSLLANRYSYEEITDILKIEIKENGIDLDFTRQHLYAWCQTHCKEELENLDKYKDIKEDKKQTDNEMMPIKKTSIFKNLVD